MNLGSRLFENTTEQLKLIRERLKSCDCWAELIDDGDIANEEELAMRELPKLLAEILRLYDNL